MSGVALVLGAGGTVGHAYHAGVLNAIGADLGWDARSADLIVGTSAGSIVASLLRAGMSPADMIRRGSGLPLSPEGEAVAQRAHLGPPRARPERTRASGSMSSPTRVRAAVRAPWAGSPGSLAAALMPEGRVPTGELMMPVENLYGESWPQPPMWIVAVQLDSGRRVAFGRSDAPPATPAEAVRASCAIPAFFEPATIDGERYVDGGVHSTTNADLVIAEQPDLVVISAPMSAARGAVRIGPSTAMRQVARLSLTREVVALRARDIPVFVLQPTAADIELMVGDSLDPSKFGPVATSAEASTRRRLARADVRERLAALG